MTSQSARAIVRAVSPDCTDADGDFLRAQIRHVPPPLGFGVRILAAIFALSPTRRRLQKWRRSRIAPLRDFAAMCAALAHFAMHSRAEEEQK